jgi:hypothetical protein
MEVDTALLIAIGVLMTLAIIWVGYRLDRRSHHAQSESWMRHWMIRNRVLADLYRRWHGPPRLQDQRSISPSAPAARKVATRRRKRTRKPPS